MWNTYGIIRVLNKQGKDNLNEKKEKEKEEKKIFVILLFMRIGIMTVKAVGLKIDNVFGFG